MNIENVAKALGISRKSADALDALDGQADKQVKQSIYDEAAKLLNCVNFAGMNFNKNRVNF